jgi:hypothetical protein
LVIRERLRMDKRIERLFLRAIMDFTWEEAVVIKQSLVSLRYSLRCQNIENDDTLYSRDEYRKFPNTQFSRCLDKLIDKFEKQLKIFDANLNGEIG